MAFHLASGSADRTVRKINADGNEVWSFTGHTNPVRSVAVDSEGNVYSGSQDQTVRKIDANGNEVWSFTGHTNYVLGVAVYSASATGIFFFDSDGKLIEQQELDKHVRGTTGDVIHVQLYNYTESPLGDIEVQIRDGPPDDTVEISKTNDPFVPEASLTSQGPFEDKAKIGDVYVRVTVPVGSDALEKTFKLSAGVEV